MARKNYAYVNCSMLKWAREETQMELTYHRLLKQRSWLSYTKYP